MSRTPSLSVFSQEYTILFFIPSIQLVWLCAVLQDK
jgi:hypothetical protein